MSTSTLPTFYRFPSPAVSATAADLHHDKPEARQAALGLADSFSDVLASVPTAYRECVKLGLKVLSDTAQKCEGVRISLLKLRGHQADGSWPPQLLGMHRPKFDITKEFSGTSPVEVAQLDAAYNQSRASILEMAVELKSRELEHLEGLLYPQSYIPGLLESLNTRYGALKSNHQQPRYGNGVNGDLVIIGWEPIPIHRIEYERLCKDIAALASRVIVIERSKISAEEGKKAAKKALKNSADVEMGDATTASASMKDIVRKEIAVAMKKAKNTSSGVSLLSTNWFDHPLTARPLSEEGENGREVQESRRQFERRHRQGSQKDFFGGKRQGQGCTEAFWFKEASQTDAERRQQERLELQVSKSQFRYEHPNSYPDEILYLHRGLALRYILSRAPAIVLRGARFRSSVHCGPDVIIPPHLEVNLSAGLRFMFSKKTNPELLSDAWFDFIDRLRWRVYFTKMEAMNGDKPKPYDPDYEVKKERDLCPFTEPYIETGLARGTAYVQHVIRNEVPRIKRSKNFKFVDVSDLAKYLKSHNYIVTMTDKNLGCSIVTKDWFINKCLLLLADRKCYREITPAERQTILETQCTKAEEAATFAEKYCEHPQLGRFLRSKVPLDKTEEPKVPVFYGIPKIHKTPVKMRPIIPCHSAVQNPAAKYVSKMLKPILATQNYILKGSKDLAQKLANLNLDYNRKWFLVGGDIVAFYPNVPYQPCADIVYQLYRDAVGLGNETRALRHLFSICLKLGTRRLILDFQDKTYLQVQGLAMGVACSPDMANLYAAKFEEEILPKPDIPFFGRYIDDVLCIVYADSEEEALRKASVIKYPGLEIEWSASEKNMPFLDMLVYIDPCERRRPQHKPYRKARNHLERIPWASAHPLDVKKGTFIGEMSRLATLSSTHANYLEGLRDLHDLYFSRGYPQDLISSWLRVNSQIRWQRRLGSPSDPVDVFVLKTYFNPAWEALNIHTLGQLVTSSWIDSLIDIDMTNRQHDNLNKRLRTTGVDTETNATERWFHFLGRDADGREIPAIRLSPNPGMNVDLPSLGSQDAQASDDPAEGATSIPGDATVRRKPEVLIKKWSQSGRIWTQTRHLDVRGAGFVTRKWLISRKRNANLFDVVAQLKKSVLTSQEDALSLGAMSIDNASLNNWE
jgi:hypothetical protein